MRRSSVQARVDLSALGNGVACFGTGERRHAVAILDVVGTELDLANADDAVQEELLAGRAEFLNAQTGPFQLLVRAEPVDLEAHLRRVAVRAQPLPQALRSAASDYTTFVRTLCQQRTLLERHCYVVLPDQRLEAPAVSLARRLRGLFERRSTLDAPNEPDGGVPTPVARRLQARADLVSRQLARSGLHTHRLDNQQIAELLHRCWSPVLARVQRIRDEIGAYTALVVSARRPATLTPRENTGGEPNARAEQLFELGTRTLADLIAPSGCEVRADHLRLDGQYARALVLTGYPRLVIPGWLSVLTETDLPLELSVHVHPLSSAEMVRTLGTRIARLQSSRLAAFRGERVSDPEQDIALEDAERLRERLQRGQERVFAVSQYLLVRARSLRELDDLTVRVEEQLDALLAHSRRALWEQERALCSCRPEARDQLMMPRNLDTSALAATLPFVSPSLAMESGMLVGLNRISQTPVLLDPFDRSLDNANLVVVAPAGAGKSFFCKLTMLRQLINGTECIAIDPEDEYRRLADAVGGQVVRLSASASHRINPFDLPVVRRELSDSAFADHEQEDPLAERVTALIELLEIMLAGDSGTLDNYERAVLDRALYRTYAEAGITSDPSTHRRPAPLLRDLNSILDATPGDIAGSLAVRLERYVTGSLGAGLFAGPTNVELDGRLVVFNVQQLEDELRPLAIHLIAGWVWARVRRDRRPRLLVVDEAWSLLRYPQGGAFLAAMARRARKYYLGLVTITQQVSDLVDQEHGVTILSNAAQVLLLKQKADTIDAATTRFRLTGEERQQLLGADKGEGLLLVRGNRIPLQVVASPAEYRLATTNPRDLAEIGARRSATSESSDSTHNSIDAIANGRRSLRQPALPVNGTSHGALN